MSKRIFITALLLAILAGLNGQLSKKHKSLFLEAEYNYLIEYYQKALNQFENLLLADPGNNNLNYLCGLCSNNLPGNNAMSIDYLEKAVTDISLSYREGSYKETKASPKAYILLARSYHIANRFNEAIHYYELYRDSTQLSSFSEIAFINHQIKSVELAMSMMEQSQKVVFTDLLDADSRAGSFRNPVVSGNDSTMIYIEEKNQNYAIMMTTFQDGKWSNPRRINGELDVSGNFSPTCLSFDGHELYLVAMEYYNADIYVAKYSGHRWERAEPLNKHVNSRFNETHASISRDGNHLYFTSDRKGGHGGLDIYTSSRENHDEWMEVDNLGSVINTVYHEETPFLADNDTKLYFSSEGHQTMGGFDIFRSALTEDGTWSSPANIGYPVNTSADNLFYNPAWDDNTGYYAWRTEDQTNTALKSIAVMEQAAATPIQYDEPKNPRPGQDLADNVILTENDQQEDDDKAGELTIQFIALKRDRDASYFKELGPVMKHVGADGFNRYTYGIYANREDAGQELKKLEKKGYRNAFIVAIQQLDGSRGADGSPTTYTDNYTP